MLGKVDEKGGFKQWQQQPSRKQQLLPVTDSHCCRLAQISRAASGVRHETMKAMPATGGVVSDRGWAHVHIVVHKMRARGRVLACAHAHACASACCVRPRGWHGRLICGAGVIGRRGLFGVRSQTGDLSLYISQLVLTFSDGEGTSFASSEVPPCAAILVVVVPASRGGREEK